MEQSNSTVLCTAGGIFLSLLPNLHSEDVLKTVILAAVGAVVSFTLSKLLQLLVRKRKK